MKNYKILHIRNLKIFLLLFALIVPWLIFSFDLVSSEVMTYLYGPFTFFVGILGGFLFIPFIDAYFVGKLAMDAVIGSLYFLNIPIFFLYGLFIEKFSKHKLGLLLSIFIIILLNVGSFFLIQPMKTNTVPF